MIDELIGRYWIALIIGMCTLVGLCLIRGIFVDESIAVQELKNLRFTNIKIVSKELCPFTSGCDYEDAAKFKAEVTNNEKPITVFAYVKWPLWTRARVATH